MRSGIFKICGHNDKQTDTVIPTEIPDFEVVQKCIIYNLTYHKRLTKVKPNPLKAITTVSNAH